MEDSVWRNLFLFFILQFTGALSRDLSLYSTVRAGDDVTLSCENVINGHRNCDTKTWLHSKSGQSEELVGLGQVKNIRTDRLSVSPNCSLVVKKVTDEDVGLYSCRQFVSGSQSGPDAAVHLSLVRLTQHEDQNRMTLSCSVVTDGPCKHSVKWFMSNNVDEEDKEITETSSSCSAAVTFQTSSHIYQSRFNTFKCEVKTEDKVQHFTFSSPPSEKDETTTTSTVTSKLDETSANKMTSTNTPSGQNVGKSFLWLFVTLPLLLLVMITTLFILLKKTRGHKAKQTSHDGATLRPAETRSASEYQQHEVDPENGVSYASISYTKKSNSSRDKNDDEGEAVTYSTVKAPAIDPSSLYASIKRPNKQSEVP